MGHFFTYSLRMPTRFALARVVFASTVCLAPAVCTLNAQELPKDKQTPLLISARQQVYNLRTSGVKSYTCDVFFDWDDFFTQVAGKPLPKDDPTMVYLNSLKLVLVNDLSGDASMKFIDAGAPPEERKDGVEKLKGSIKQMVGGFVQAWTPTLNGTIIPAEVDSLKKTPDGYLLTGKGEESTSETLDSNLHLTGLSVQSKELSSTMQTTFVPSPKGLLMTEMAGDYREPDATAPTHVVMKTTFAPVEGAQLPATLQASVPNVATFKFAFRGCTVEKQK